MTQKELETRLAAAVEHSTPDILDQLLLACGPSKGAEEPVKRSHIQEAAPKKRRRPLMLVAALALAACGVLAGWQLHAASVPVARVALDVNPSVEFTLDRRDKLVEVTPCNAEGQQLLTGLSLEDQPVEEAVDQLVDALADGGFLLPEGGTVLISVDAEDAKAEALRVQLTRQVRQAMDDHTLHGDVLSQQVDATEALGQQAQDWNTSFGRAAYYGKIAAAANVDPSQMAGLSVQQAGYLLDSRGLSMEQAGVECEIDEDVTRQDLADSSLLSSQRALELAQAAAGVVFDTAEVELDVEHGQLVYEVELHTGGTEYTVHLDAQSGAVLRTESERDDDRDEPEDWEEQEDWNEPEDWDEPEDDPDEDDRSEPADTPAGAALSPEQALEIGLRTFGVSREALTEKEVEPDRENGRSVYEVEFKAGGMEYELTLDAQSGQVLEQHSEPED